MSEQSQDQAKPVSQPALIQPVELRTENGALQGKLYPGQRLEILRHGVLTVYDVQTGRRMATCAVTRRKPANP